MSAITISYSYQDNFSAELRHDGAYSRLAIPCPGTTAILKIAFAVPIIDMQGFWTPEMRTPAARLEWNITARSAGQRSFPYLAFLNSQGVNRLSLGLTDLADDTEIRAKMNQERCTYDITIQTALTPQSRPFELILDERPEEWTKILADWRAVLALPETHFPEAAWEPVYCTWYAVHAAVTQDWVEKSAAKAAELGFGTLIIDDGWCFDAMKRVTPDTLGSWYEWIGDWEISKRKFPDFASHRRRIRELGLNYLFWVAPFLVGAKSRFAGQFPEAHDHQYREGCFTMDGSAREAMDAMLEKMRHVMLDYALDGLKADFLDHILPDLKAPRGQSVTAWIARLAQTVRAVKPDALIEFRQSYATPGMKPYGTQFRAGDVPFDFTDNFQRLAQIRVSMGDGVPVHADPAYWHPEEKPENIARHLIASLAGVPMLSMDLLKLGAREEKIVRHWLKFHRANRRLFRDGRWQVRYARNNTAWMSVSDGAESLAIVSDPARLPEVLEQCAKPVRILNLAQTPLVLPEAKTFDGEGGRGVAGVVPPGGLGEKS